MGFLISLKRKFRQFKKFFQDHQQAFNFIIVFLFFAIVGPLGINQIFYRPPVFPIFKVSWEIGDALSYYGVLVAAVATIVGVYVSIGAAQRSYHEDEINRVKPYIALTGYRTACKVQLFSNNPDIAASYPACFHPLKGRGNTNFITKWRFTVLYNRRCRNAWSDTRWI